MLRTGIKSLRSRLAGSQGRFSSMAARAAVGSDAGSRASWAAGAAAAALLGAGAYENNKAECCGIAGVVGDKDASEYLMEGLTILQNRGYVDPARLSPRRPPTFCRAQVRLRRHRYPRLRKEWQARRPDSLLQVRECRQHG